MNLPAILIVPQLGYLDRPLYIWLAILFRDSVATEVTLVLAPTHQATVEAGHASPAGCSPFSLLSTTARTLKSGAYLLICILRDLVLIHINVIDGSLDHLLHRLAAELRYYYRIPVVVKRPSSFHISISPTVDVFASVSGNKISTAVYPVVGPSSNASS